MSDTNTNINCFHCSEPVPDGLSLNVEIFGKQQPMCCRGCQAIAQTIMDYGYGEYYKHRTQHPATPELLVPENIRKFKLFDLPDIQKKFIKKINGDICEATLILDGVVCPACVWMIEKHISTLPGIIDLDVNYSSNRARLAWDKSRLQLSDVMQAIAGIGYKAYPYEPGRDQLLSEKERKDQIRRIGLAGLLGMQVMMISIALYIGEWSGIDHTTKKFFHWLCLLLTTPVFFYSGLPFFRAAWRNIRQHYPGMDIPVSLGISLAYSGSIWSTISDTGDVYFDSVVMFIFFLSIGRYLEFAARRKSIQHTENLNRIIPAMASRLVNIGEKQTEELIPVAELKTGDLVLVRAGETIPADGTTYDGKTSVDESLITGESLPIIKDTGSELIGGSTNIESPVKVTITRIGEDTLLSQILRLADRSRSEKPLFTQIANRISGWFILGVLFITVMAAWYWWHEGRDIWLPVTISVLVATCPCALSLATPAAMTTAINAYLKTGIAITRQSAIERLAKITHFVFDKTGTLTYGNLQLDTITSVSGNDEMNLLALAAALEQHSEHPAGRAIVKSCKNSDLHATKVQNYPGEGIAGIIENRQYYLGTRNFITGKTGLVIDKKLQKNMEDNYKSTIILASQNEIEGVFSFTDEIRPHAKQLINYLKSAGIKTILLSGDKHASVRHIADELEIDVAVSDLKPDGKLSFLKSLRDQNAIVAMLGDGINDAPVLAAADFSMAMGSGTSISKISADMILLNDDLEKLKYAIQTARKTFKIIRQNIVWAIAYNISILPVAVTGIIMPWMAAIGMSLSSLIVVVNAARVKNQPG